MKKLLLVTATSIISATQAYALTQNITLDLHERKLKGHTKVSLSQKIMQQKGEVLRGWKVKSASVLAKSKDNRSALALSLGPVTGIRSRVPGSPENFRNLGAGLSKINLEVPNLYRGERHSEISLLTTGVVRVSEVNLALTKQLPPRLLDVHRMPLRQVKTIKGSKFESTKTKVRVTNAKAIALKGEKRNSKIKSVTLVMKNGQKIVADELKGTLRSGQMKGMILPREMRGKVMAVIVKMKPSDIIGSRSKISVHVSL